MEEQIGGGRLPSLELPIQSLNHQSNKCCYIVWYFIQPKSSENNNHYQTFEINQISIYNTFGTQHVFGTNVAF